MWIDKKKLLKKLENRVGMVERRKFKAGETDCWINQGKKSALLDVIIMVEDWEKNQ